MIMKAILLATALAGVTVYAFGKVQFPASVFILDAILCIFGGRTGRLLVLWLVFPRRAEAPSLQFMYRDGKPDLVFAAQISGKLLWVEIPEDPTVSSWPDIHEVKDFLIR